MKLTGKLSIVSGALAAAVAVQAVLIVSHARTSLSDTHRVANRDSVFNNTVLKLESDFYGYDDQMNMYVLVAQRGQTGLANTTYQQAQQFRQQFQAGLSKAQGLASTGRATALLSEVSQQMAAYNQDATQVRNDLLNHRVSAAVAMQTTGNNAPSNAIMSLLSKLTAAGQAQLDSRLLAVDTSQNSSITWAWVTAVAVILFLVLVLFLVEWSAIRPLRQLKEVAEHLAEGNVQDEVRMNSADELGDLARAFRQMMTYLTDAGAVAQAISQGDLTVSPTAQGPDDVLGQSLVAMHSQLRDLINALQAAGKDVDGSANELTHVISQTTEATRQIATAIAQTAQATGESSQGLQQITSAMQEFKTAVDQVSQGTARQAEQVDHGEVALASMKEAQSLVHETTVRMEQLAVQSRDTAQQGRMQVEQTLAAIARIAEVAQLQAESVNRLGRHSEQIGAIAGTIADIASQTNLLALNANIEAARAGEHGRGFAVVADEVRKLAEQSSQEAKNVSDIIHTIQETVQLSLELMEKSNQEVTTGQTLARETSTAIGEMDDAVSQVADQIGAMSQTVSALEKQSLGVDQGMREIARIAQENAAATQQMSASLVGITDTVEGLAAISEETAAATEEVSTTSEHVAESTRSLSTKADVLSQVVERLNRVVSRYQL
ncbi:methyl-accepting chemotaxis protein [Sulfobacillus harzensis]|uniref:HAMP domain-containing protein n=1 Tax=Sulfobacillus harzensis TaxID=2729629 RepID=A0A7Y0L6Q6_9FIRM|nr:HAMP domain-containing methyl-accepting chemotaxis protein [Sulfobacillus harzensis]NMP24338.1 HAMP domain-containing protein [Sulfobacillus harzensis]